MENKRWLNIVVDGNKALEQYWTDILSNYLEKIVRCFVGESQEQESYLGLVLYNANSELVEAGYDMQFINWTKDVNKFMGNLSHLSFNGNDANQSTMAEGLAEALVMYPKPCDTMTEREYYNSERHCILVAPGDPAPKSMLVCLPMIQRAQVIGQRLKACQADFLEVAKTCVPLAVSMSVITPNPVPIFGAIFNMGNNVLTLSSAPISSYSTGQLTVLLSKNFKEAHIALKEKGIMEYPSTTSVGSFSATPDTTLFRAFSTNLQEEQVSSSMAIGDRIHETGNAITPEPVSTSQHNSQELVVSKATDQENIVQMNLYEDIMSELDSDDDLFKPNKRSKTFAPLEDDADLQDFFKFDQNTFFDGFDQFLEQQDQQVMNQQQIPTEEAGVDFAKELQEILNGASRNTSTAQTANVECTTSSFQEVNVQPEELRAPAPNAGEGSSTGLLHESNLQLWYNPHAMTSTSTLDSQSFPTNAFNGNMTSISTLDSQSSQTNNFNRNMTSTSTLDSQSFPTNAFNGNFTFSNVMANSQMQQPQPVSSQNQFSGFPGFARGQIGNFSGQPVGQTGNFSGQPVGQHFQAYNHFLRNNNTAAYNLPAFGANTWLRPMQSLSPSYPSARMHFPTLEEIQDYVQTWEGTLAGKITSSRTTILRAKAFKKSSTPPTLTLGWPGRLEISNYLPQKALLHTRRFSQPIHYLFFHVAKYGNVDLYNHCKTRNNCAKVDLQFQTIILSPTEREPLFVGTVFPGGTIFIEQA
ncbi:mediator of RNA polymerase II transcription subunit 25 isoform X2 [Medicago truncatula]|uniref:mediator of RNA polymerase II transcription subunit 25 isoform X2 n=1 Tax=Medicago truncatula TaxID=3880 RepID=UPI001967FB1F|nr:mediator of RNA polymerase II transcription subunit 25 isoform X2 [Medicago truncatula]